MPQLSEEPLKYGENGRGIAIATIPAEFHKDSPILVIFNAGLLHRSEPFRMNVDVARRCAELGCVSVRFDLSGKGDTPNRNGLSNRESVKTDWLALKQCLEKRFGAHQYILMGLCSGADNAIKTAFYDHSVHGLILLDPRIPQESGHQLRALLHQIKNIETWKRSPGIIMRLFKRLFSPKKTQIPVNVDQVRDLPSNDELVQACQRVLQENGRVLSFFTNFSLPYYNKDGQFRRFLNISENDQTFEEHWWPQVDHVYSVSIHRKLMVDTVSSWLGSK